MLIIWTVCVNVLSEVVLTSILPLCLAWEPDSRYVYNVRGRVLTALHQTANQYTGIMIKAQLAIEPNSRHELRGKV